MADSDDESTQPERPAGSAAGDEEPRQRAAIRRQQRSVAVAGSVIAGLAVAVSVLQRYPELAPLGVVAGVVSGLVVYRLATHSIFPESESDDDSDETTATSATDGEPPE